MSSQRRSPAAGAGALASSHTFKFPNGPTFFVDEPPNDPTKIGELGTDLQALLKISPDPGVKIIPKNVVETPSANEPVIPIRSIGHSL